MAKTLKAAPAAAPIAPPASIAAAQPLIAAMTAMNPKAAIHDLQSIAFGLVAHGPAAKLTTQLRMAHFLAQAAEETGGFIWFRELGAPSYFAKYEHRADLGNTQDGDGYLFRGRGIFMLTGRANYAAMGPKIGMDLIGQPGLAADPNIAAFIACIYWESHNINPLADADDIEGVTRKINGGLNGLATRQAYLAKAKKALGI